MLGVLPHKDPLEGIDVDIKEVMSLNGKWVLKMF